MSITTSHKPVPDPTAAPAAMATVGALIFLGINAIRGGIAMVVGVGAPPQEWLDNIPALDSRLAPGLALVPSRQECA